MPGGSTVLRNCELYWSLQTNIYTDVHYVKVGTWWRSWLTHCATSRRVAGSIPEGVIAISHWHNPSGRTMTLGSTQPLTEMSARDTSRGVKATGAWGWQPYHLHVPTVLKSESINLLELSEIIQACNRGCFTCTFLHYAEAWLQLILFVSLLPQLRKKNLIQGVPGGMDKTSGECSLCWTIPI